MTAPWPTSPSSSAPRRPAARPTGAAQYGGTPSKVLEARLKHAKNLYTQGVAKHIVTTGGRQPGDEYTEAEASANWLEHHGVPEDAVVDVPEGSDTLGSLRA